MIKAVMRTKQGVPMLFLGLSGENVTRLAAGEPIRIGAAQMEQLGLPPMEVAIHYGRTEEVILNELRAHGLKMEEARDGERDLYPFTPDWTLRPGTALAEILADRKMDTAAAAACTGLTAGTIAGIAAGTVRIDEPIAERLHTGFGVSARFWLNYQANYEADLARGAKDVSDD